MTATNDSTPVQDPRRTDRRVFDAMLPYLTDRFGNAASLNHTFGWAAQDACDHAREQIAGIIHARAGREIIFTSSGDESNILAVKGVADTYAHSGNHIITTTCAHPSILETCHVLEKEEHYCVTRLEADGTGCPDPDALRAAITDGTNLITLSLRPNGHDIPERIVTTGRLVKRAEVFFHVDATDVVEHYTIDVQANEMHLLSINGNGIGGPPGTGALYVRSRKPRINLVPLIDGGGQEKGWRSGTLNVPGIVGLGAACVLNGKGKDTPYT